MLIQKQREDISKFFFDLAKLSFAGLIIGSLIPTYSFSLLIFGLGLFLTISFFALGVMFDKPKGG